MSASPNFDQATGFSAGPGLATPTRLHRSSRNRVFAGVCGGIAETYRADATALRLLAVVIGLFTAVFPAILLYIVAAIVVPEQVGDDPNEATNRSIPGSPTQGALVFGLILVVIGLMSLANQVFHIAWDEVWPVGLIAVGAAIVVAAVRR